MFNTVAYIFILTWWIKNIVMKICTVLKAKQYWEVEKTLIIKLQLY